MPKAQTGSQRVVRPGARKRRPALACIQCYGRKLKCGREYPACSRCAKGGKADQCTYRDDKFQILPTESDKIIEERSNSVDDNRDIPLSPREAHGEPSRLISSQYNGDIMTYLKGQGTLTKFYGYSYHLNFYQQVRLDYSTDSHILLSSK